uniref:Candidate secreted effector n=1 Tax=Meloidogyne incognita TaxID=6306 RepID=A0A914MC06_MELIC
MLLSDFLFNFLTRFNIFFIFVCRRLLNIFQYFFRSYFSDFLFMFFMRFNIFILYDCRRIFIIFLRIFRWLFSDFILFLRFLRWR